MRFIIHILSVLFVLVKYHLINIYIFLLRLVPLFPRILSALFDTSKYFLLNL